MPRKKKDKVQFRQVRVTIPTDDPVAIEWINNQRRDASLAIRLLIHRQVKRNGIGNIFATADSIDDVEDTKPAQTQTKSADKPAQVELENKPEPEPKPETKSNAKKEIDQNLKDIEDMMG